MEYCHWDLIRAINHTKWCVYIGLEASEWCMPLTVRWMVPPLWLSQLSLSLCWPVSKVLLDDRVELGPEPQELTTLKNTWGNSKMELHSFSLGKCLGKAEWWPSVGKGLDVSSSLCFVSLIYHSFVFCFLVFNLVIPEGKMGGRHL